MTSTDFSTRLYLSSVQLNRLDDMQKPAGFASGCLIDYFGKRVLLTVAHAAGKQGNWAMQVKYVPGMGTQNQPLGSMHFLAKASLTDPTLREVDFSYAEIPATVLPYRQEIESKDVITREAPITVHRTTLEDNPHSASTYGFCGMVLGRHEIHFGDLYVGGEIRVYPGLAYSRTEGDYHVFTLPFKHPGHEHFEGCSGAPVLSESGELVGLVCHGVVEKDEIWAISVSGYRVALHILAGAV
jgi:hypothetical protein